MRAGGPGAKRPKGEEGGEEEGEGGAPASEGYLAGVLAACKRGFGEANKAREAVAKTLDRIIAKLEERERKAQVMEGRGREGAQAAGDGEEEGE